MPTVIDKYCFWKYGTCLECNSRGTATKWELKSDCGHEVIMTRSNKYYRLMKATCQPHPCGTELGVKCPYCGKELQFYNPYED